MKTAEKCPLLILICLAMVLFSACAKPPEDPYKDYVSSGLEPKTAVAECGEYDDRYDFEKWHGKPTMALLTSFSDYIAFDIDLGYAEGYFEINSLLIILETGCSSDNPKFIEVLENEEKLYPVVERNYIGPNDPVTDDIIYLIFYVEVPDSGNYAIGEVIYRYRTENVMM